MGVFRNLFGKKKSENEKGYFIYIIEDVFRLKAQGCVVVGNVQGTDIHLNDKACVCVSNGATLYTKIGGLENGSGKLSVGKSGTHVGILLPNISPDHIQKGDILTNRPDVMKLVE